MDSIYVLIENGKRNEAFPKDAVPETCEQHCTLKTLYDAKAGDVLMMHVSGDRKDYRDIPIHVLADVSYDIWKHLVRPWVADLHVQIIREREPFGEGVRVGA